MRENVGETVALEKTSPDRFGLTMTRKGHNTVMSSCHQILKQLDSRRHGHAKLWLELFQVPTAAGLSTACQLGFKKSYWKSSLNCSLMYKYGKSAGLVKALHSVMFRLCLRNCITPFSFACKNMLCHYWYLSVVPCILILNILIRFHGII